MNKERFFILEDYEGNNFSEDMYDDGMDDEMPMENDGEGIQMSEEDAEPIIVIRKMALQGIQENDPLGENPNEEMYDLYKKIWMMCDKAMEVSSNDKKENKEQ